MKSINCMSIKDAPIILHTMDSYCDYWDLWFYFFKKHCPNYVENVIFCTETKYPSFCKKLKTFKTGKGEWGERLLKILDSIDAKYVFYMQEDFWPISKFPFTQDLFNFAQSEQVDCFRISEPCQFYSIIPISPNIYQYTQNSLYTLSHQFSMWDKNFFYDAILPHENPWTNEIEGSKRINTKKHKIYFIPNTWYNTTVRSGKLTEIGNQMKKEALSA